MRATIHETNTCHPFIIDLDLLRTITKREYEKRMEWDGMTGRQNKHLCVLSSWTIFDGVHLNRREAKKKSNPKSDVDMHRVQTHTHQNPRFKTTTHIINAQIK